jgi:hypothetical protein
LDAERIARGILLRRLQGFGYFVVAAPIAVEAICASNEKPTSLQINCQSGARVKSLVLENFTEARRPALRCTRFLPDDLQRFKLDEAAREFTNAKAQDVLSAASQRLGTRPPDIHDEI